MGKKLGPLKLLGQSAKWLASHPTHFLILSLPAVVGECGYELLPTAQWSGVWQTALIILGGMSVLLFFFEWSKAAFYLTALEAQKGRILRPMLAAKQGLQTARHWYPAGLCMLLAVFAGSLLIVPAVYFLTVFVFVTPCAIALKGRSPLDALAYSNKLVSWRLFTPICLLILFQVLLEFELGELLSRYFSDSIAPVWQEIGVKIVSVSFHSWISVFLALLFLQLRREREQTHLGNLGASGTEKPRMG